MKRTIFIGQAMPKVKRHPYDWPTLSAWLFSIGITNGQIRKNFFYSALVDYFPGLAKGSHRVPTKEEIEKEKIRLERTINDFNPQVVVPIGKLSLSYCIGEDVKLLKDYIGKTFTLNPYGLMKNDILVIPLPHPSGASTWRHQEGNKKLLQKALNLLKENIANS